MTVARRVPDDADVHSFTCTLWDAVSCSGDGGDSLVMVAYMAMGHTEAEIKERPWLGDGRRRPPTSAERLAYTAHTETLIGVTGAILFANGGNAGNPAFICLRAKHVDKYAATVINAALVFGAHVTLQNSLLTEFAPSDAPYSKERSETLAIRRMTDAFNEFRASQAEGGQTCTEPYIIQHARHECKWPSEEGRRFARFVGSACDERCS